MSHRGAPRKAQSKVLVFGESLNDAQSIATLLVAARSDLRGRVRPRPAPTSLTRAAGPDAVDSWLLKLRKAVLANEAGGSVIAAVVVHQDADGHDPRGVNEARLRRQLRGVANEVAVPVQMIEAWWLLFPGAVRAVRPISWRTSVTDRPHDVDGVVDPKLHLMRLTRSSGHAYAEADSSKIAEHISSGKHSRVGTSASYDRWLNSCDRLLS